MLESRSDLWAHHRIPGHLVCISTNGFVKRNGAAVMGRGCALQATQMHPGVQMELGAYIRHNGNVPGMLFGPNYTLGILPVKHNWWEKADLKLIQESVDWLRREASEEAVRTIHVPRLGCGNGSRNWATEVEPLMRILPDNVIIHS